MSFFELWNHLIVNNLFADHIRHERFNAVAHLNGHLSVCVHRFRLTDNDNAIVGTLLPNAPALA